MHIINKIQYIALSPPFVVSSPGRLEYNKIKQYRKKINNFQAQEKEINLKGSEKEDNNDEKISNCEAFLSFQRVTLQSLYQRKVAKHQQTLCSPFPFILVCYLAGICLLTAQNTLKIFSIYFSRLLTYWHYFQGY